MVGKTRVVEKKTESCVDLTRVVAKKTWVVGGEIRVGTARSVNEEFTRWVDEELTDSSQYDLSVQPLAPDDIRSIVGFRFPEQVEGAVAHPSSDVG